MKTHPVYSVLVATKAISIQEIIVKSWDGEQVRSRTILRPTKEGWKKAWLLSQDLSRELQAPADLIFRRIMEEAD